MKRRTRWAIGAALLVAAVGLSSSCNRGGEAGRDATVRFGNPTVGSPFQPPLFDHDSSFKAADTLIPHTSVISAGRNVTFNIAGFHQAMVYEPGTTLEDIDVPPFPPEANILIDEFDGLLESSPLPFGGLPGAVDARRRTRSTSRGATSSCATSPRISRSRRCTAG